MTLNSILTITLNPALDVTTYLDQLKPQQKLRCGPPRYDPGGGGVNVSRAIKEFGGESHAFVAVAGATGQWYRRILDETGIESQAWEFRGETRFALTVMEEVSGLQYRFMLPGPEQDEQEAERLLSALTQTMGSRYRFVVASGSLPPGLPHDFYARLADRVREAGAALILDTSGPALKATLAQRPYLIKIDQIEAQELVMGSENARISMPALAQKLIDQHVAETIIITIGDKGAIVADGGQVLHVQAPAVEVISAVGAGDSFVAALTLGLADGWSLEDASRFGVAAAASAVTTQATALCERAATQQLFEQTVATRITQMDG